jgi:hypothetical protein
MIKTKQTKKHHRRHHHHQPQPECAHIRQQSMGSGQQFPLESLSGRSALHKFELPTIPAESKATIANTMTIRHREIMSRWAR